MILVRRRVQLVVLRGVVVVDVDIVNIGRPVISRRLLPLVATSDAVVVRDPHLFLARNGSSVSQVQKRYFSNRHRDLHRW